MEVMCVWLRWGTGGGGGGESSISSAKPDKTYKASESLFFTSLTIGLILDSGSGR